MLLGSLIFIGAAGLATAAKVGVRDASDEPGSIEQAWKDPEFAKRFLGYDATLEPKLSAEEQALLKSLDERKLLTEQPKKAIRELEAKITPASSALLSYSLATLYLREGESAHAIKHYESAVAKFPKFMRAYKNLGFALAREGNFAAAVPHLSRSVELGGADSVTFGILGFCYLNLEKFISAEAAYKNAMIYAPDSADWKLGLIKSLTATGNYGQATALLDELILQNPANETLWMLQANVFLQQEDAKKAAVNIEFVRKLGKAKPQHLFLLGDIYVSLNSNDLALSIYLEAIARDDHDNIAKALRAADILTSRGAWAEARAIFKKIRGSPEEHLNDDLKLKLLKLEFKTAMATGEGAQAIQTLEEIIMKNPLDGEALLLAGDYYAKNGQPEKAEFRYDTASKIAGFEADASVKHAQVLVQSKKYVQAAELLRKAQKIKPRENVQQYLDKVEQVARSTRP